MSQGRYKMPPVMIVSRNIQNIRAPVFLHRHGDDRGHDLHDAILRLFLEKIHVQYALHYAEQAQIVQAPTPIRPIMILNFWNACAYSYQISLKNASERF